MRAVSKSLLFSESDILQKKGKSIRLALDFDGVVTNPHKQKAIELNRLGFSLKEDQTSRDYCTNVLRIPFEQYRVAATRANVDNLLSIPLEEKAGKILRLLNEEGVEIFLVTSRMDDEIRFIPTYLEKHNIVVNGILNSNEQSKSDCLARIQPDIFIEDTMSKLLSVLDAISLHKSLLKCHFLLFRNISNNYISVNEKRIIIVNDWDEVFFFIMGIKSNHNKGSSGYI